VEAQAPILAEAEAEKCSPFPGRLPLGRIQSRLVVVVLGQRVTVGQIPDTEFHRHSSEKQRNLAAAENHPTTGIQPHQYQAEFRQTMEQIPASPMVAVEVPGLPDTLARWGHRLARE